MRRVLVDDDDAVRGLGDDIGLVQLGAGGAQRIGLGFRRRYRARGRRRLGQGRLIGCRLLGQTRHQRGRGAAAPGPGRQTSGLERSERGLGHGVGSAVAGGRQRVTQRTDDQAAYQTGVAEAHLGLGGVDVDVELVLRAIEEQHHHGMAVARQEILVGAAHRAGQQLVAHRPSVDEQILVLGGRAVERRQPGEARQFESFARCVDGERVVGEVAAQQRAEPRLARIRRAPRRQIGGGVETQDGLFLVAGDGEGYCRIGHGQALDRVDRGVAFGARRFEEFEPRRGGVEQLAHLDPGAGRMRSGLDRALGAAFDRDAGGG